MKLHTLVQTSLEVSQTRSRREKIKLLAGCLAQAEGDEVATCVAYLSGELPDGRLGVGWSSVQKAMAVPGASESSLTVGQVSDALRALGALSGVGSAAHRARQLEALFGGATEGEQGFLAALLVGELRQGALEGIMADAIAAVSHVQADAVRRAVMLTGNVSRVAELALQKGLEGLSALGVELFRPVQPMLAETAEDVAEALGGLSSAAFEYKLDGARIQVHKRGRDVAVFTRRLNEVTAAVPEVVEAVLALPAREIILDGEVIALRADGRPEPFQVTMRRFGRKLDVAEMRRQLPLTMAAFDCLWLDGQSLIDSPTRERFAALAQVVPEAYRVPRLTTADAEAAAAFMASALAAGHEGLMAKDLETPYQAGRRGQSWLKIKAPRTLDLVVLAAEWGHGRRQGWLSNLHLGARDASGSFVMLGKTFKGLTDEMLSWQTEKLLSIERLREEHVVWVEPRLVVEIAFGDLQQSPRYPGGLALRFARVKRYRPDKTPNQADTMDTVRALFAAQTAPIP